MDANTLKNFDPLASRYARARPSAPREVFEALAARVPPPADVLEIGCGPGNATLPLAQRGYRIHAIELGATLAELARQRLAGFPFTLQVGAFEDADLTAASVDLVVSSSAFHWLDPERAWNQVARALRPGGTVALFWPSAGRELDDPPFSSALQDLYREHAPTLGADMITPARQALDAIGATLQGDARFEAFEERQFTEALTFEGPAFIDLLGTYSDHAQLDAEVRRSLEAAIVRRVDAQPGGRVMRNAMTRMFLARRR